MSPSYRREPGRFRICVFTYLFTGKFAAGAPVPKTPAPQNFEDGLELLSNGQIPGERFILRAEFRVGNRHNTLRIFGRGVGYWNDEKQFSISSEQFRRIILALRKAHYAKMPSSFGHGTSIGNGLEAVSHVYRVWVTIGGFLKYVDQADKGEQSKELADVMALVREMSANAAKDGVLATDFRDGMQKLASGSLAPEALEIYINLRDQRRWLSIRGRHVAAYEAEIGRFTERTLILSRAEFQELFEMLEPSWSRWDTKMQSPESVDFSVELLNHKIEVTISPAEGPAAVKVPTTIPRDFKRLMSKLDALHRRAMKEGFAIRK